MPRLMVGMKFPSGLKLRQTVEEFSVRNEFQLKRKKRMSLNDTWWSVQVRAAVGDCMPPS